MQALEGAPQNDRSLARQPSQSKALHKPAGSLELSGFLYLSRGPDKITSGLGASFPLDRLMGLIPDILPFPGEPQLEDWTQGPRVVPRRVVFKWVRIIPI